MKRIFLEVIFLCLFALVPCEKVGVRPRVRIFQGVFHQSIKVLPSKKFYKIHTKKTTINFSSPISSFFLPLFHVKNLISLHILLLQDPQFFRFQGRRSSIARSQMQEAYYPEGFSCHPRASPQSVSSLVQEISLAGNVLGNINFRSEILDGTQP